MVYVAQVINVAGDHAQSSIGVGGSKTSAGPLGVLLAEAGTSTP